MKNILKALLVLASSLLFAGGAQALPLCQPPLTSDCFDPQWGVIEPDGLDASTGSSDSTAMRSSPKPRMQLVAAHDDRAKQASNRSSASRLVIDDGREYRDQTAALLSAIRRASFDREGKLVSGDRAIATAAAALYRVSANHQLNIYIRTPKSFAQKHFDLLARKVAAINRILAEAAGGVATSSGPKS